MRTLTEKDRMWKAAKRRYIGPILTFGYQPPSLSFYSPRLRKHLAKGRVIVHNQIAHTKDMPIPSRPSRSCRRMCLPGRLTPQSWGRADGSAFWVGKGCRP
jgi:hypothetical protein